MMVGLTTTTTRSVVGDVVAIATCVCTLLALFETNGVDGLDGLLNFQGACGGRDPIYSKHSVKIRGPDGGLWTTLGGFCADIGTDGPIYKQRAEGQLNCAMLNIHYAKKPQLNRFAAAEMIDDKEAFIAMNKLRRAYENKRMGVKEPPAAADDKPVDEENLYYTHYGAVCPQKLFYSELIDYYKELRFKVEPVPKSKKQEHMIVEDEPEDNPLNLSILFPKERHSGEGHPILFFVHGGGYNSGSAALFHYMGVFTHLTSHGFMVVFAHYRYGPFGFLNVDERGRLVNEFGEDQRQEVDRRRLNIGLHDQRTALDFVHKYIHFFGGDPKRLVLAGQSAGAASVSMLALEALRKSSNAQPGRSPTPLPFKALLLQSAVANVMVESARSSKSVRELFFNEVLLTPLTVAIPFSVHKVRDRIPVIPGIKRPAVARCTKEEGSVPFFHFTQVYLARFGNLPKSREIVEAGNEHGGDNTKAPQSNGSSHHHLAVEPIPANGASDKSDHRRYRPSEWFDKAWTDYQNDGNLPAAAASFRKHHGSTAAVVEPSAIAEFERCHLSIQILSDLMFVIPGVFDAEQLAQWHKVYLLKYIDGMPDEKYQQYSHMAGHSMDLRLLFQPPLYWAMGATAADAVDAPKRNAKFAKRAEVMAHAIRSFMESSVGPATSGESAPTTNSPLLFDDNHRLVGDTGDGGNVEKFPYVEVSADSAKWVADGYVSQKRLAYWRTFFGEFGEAPFGDAQGRPIRVSAKQRKKAASAVGLRGMLGTAPGSYWESLQNSLANHLRHQKSLSTTTSQVNGGSGATTKGSNTDNLDEHDENGGVDSDVDNPLQNIPTDGGGI